MPRQSRIILPGIPLHITQRGNNRQACFFRERDYLFFIERLEESALESNCLVHAFVLMRNHIHLLLTPKDISGAGNLMKSVGQRYSQYFNRTYDRTGTLWEGRFRSSIVQQEKYLFICHRYIEMNPVRARIVKRPEEYQWTSYRVNGFGEESDLITHHPLYNDLGGTSHERQESYRGLFDNELAPEVMGEIRRAENGSLALGNRIFHEKISEIVGRRLSTGRIGRPKKGSVPVLKKGDRPLF